MNLSKEMREFLCGLASYTTVALFLLFAFSDAFTAVTTATHRSYALRPCSTCREVPYPTESECVAAANAEALRAGTTRTSGSAVYTCVIRHNVIATFRPNPVTGQATLSWAHDGLYTSGFRLVYGAQPDALTNTVQLPDPTLRNYTLTNLTPGLYYFAIRAYNDSGESDLSNIATKTIP